MRQSKHSDGMKLALALAAASFALAGCDQFNKGFNDSFDKRVHNDCVTAFVQHGGPADIAESYCACTVRELDKLTVQQKMSLNNSSPEIKNAGDVCVAQMKAQLQK